MTTLQIILVVIASIITLFFIVAFFLPSSKTLYRSIVINRSPGEIYNLLTDFNWYQQWNPWSLREPEADGKLSGEPGKQGHKWSWKGKKIGSGYLEIKELEKNKSIRSDLIFEEPRKMVAEDFWNLEKLDENRTKVTWGHYSRLGYPTDRFFGLALEKMLAPDFEQGLKNLKQLSESQPKDE